jgi:branched-chain amino acid transport system substrate-binding protein
VAVNGIRAVLAVAVVAAALSGCSEQDGPVAATAAVGGPGAAPGCVGEDLLDCARDSTLAPLVPGEPTAAVGEPIVIGMMNTETSPAGSYGELSRAVDAAVEFVNSELGGVGGRPVELSLCDTGFSAEGSTACGQRLAEQDVPAVLGGIDVFGNGIDVLAGNGIPFVGGIPISAPSVSAPNSFQWSGGTWGATVAFADHAASTGAERVAIVFGEFGPITQSAEYGRDVLERRGVTAQLVPHPITAVDISPAIQAAASTNPDAIIVLGADTGCRAAFDAIATLGISVPTYHVGACAMPSVLDRVDPSVAERAVFNVEGPISMLDPDPDTVLYGAVIDRYGDGLDPVGAGTVSFRSFMNLYMVLTELGPDDVLAPAVTGALEQQERTPSYMGHPYSCDRRQFDGLPAMCSPQQILAEVREGELVQIGSWIDVGAIHAG